MALQYVTVTGSFAQGDGSPATGTVVFRPSQEVYYGAQPLLSDDAPVTAEIAGGQLQSASGQPVKLLATDNEGLRYLGLTGWFAWSATVTLEGQDPEAFSFFLPSSPSSVDLYSLANTAAGGGGVRLAGDLGGTDASPEVTGTHLATPLPLEQGGTGAASAAAALTALGAAPATGLTAETARAQAAEALALAKAGNLSDLASVATARANLGLGTAATSAATAFDPSGAASSAQAAAEAYAVAKTGDTMTGHLAPAVITLTDAATITVNATSGNDFRVTLGGNRTIGAPSSPADGQPVTFEIVQDATGSRTVTWASGAGGYSFGSGSPPALSTAAGKADLVAFRYSAARGAWLFLGAGLGF